ncbi:MAG: iron-sulfur cluster assembly accessory protein [Kineosporiaceae bacterium]
MTVQNDTTQIAPEEPAHGVVLTTEAVTFAKRLMANEGRDDLLLRLEVVPGGCRGLEYKLSFVDEIMDGDSVREFDGLPLVVDDFSKEKLVGVTIGFASTLQGGEGLTIDNPNAKAGAGCACGNSFC